MTGGLRPRLTFFLAVAIGASTTVPVAQEHDSTGYELGVATDSVDKRKKARVFALGSGDPGEQHLHWQGGRWTFLDVSEWAYRLFIDQEDSPKLGLDRLAPSATEPLPGPGADSLPTLFYVGHGGKGSLDVGPKAASLPQMEFGDHRLRNLWLCSCNVMEHSYLAKPNSMKPLVFSNTEQSVFSRWADQEGAGAPALSSRLRMACGGVNKICFDHKKPLVQTWDWILNRGYPIADAWVLGLSGSQDKALCLSRGGDFSSLPLLTDFDFETVPSGVGSDYVYALYPVAYDSLVARPSLVSRRRRTRKTHAPTVPVMPVEQLRAADCANLSRSRLDESCSFYDRSWKPRPIPVNQAPTTIEERLEVALDYANQRGLKSKPSKTVAYDLVLDRVSAATLGTNAGDLRRFLKGTVFSFRRIVEGGVVTGTGGEISVLVDPTGRVRAFSRVWRPLDKEAMKVRQSRALLGVSRAIEVAQSVLADDRYRRPSDAHVDLAYKEHQGACMQTQLEPYYYVRFRPKQAYRVLPPTQVEVYGFANAEAQTVACDRPQYAP